MLLTRPALERVGKFDPNYYFYFDDWDLSARFREAGFQILFIPQARLWHKVSMSTRKADRPARWWHVLGKSSVRYYLRHASGWVLSLHTAWVALREAAKLQPGHILPFLFGVAEGLAERAGWRT